MALDLGGQGAPSPSSPVTCRQSRALSISRAFSSLDAGSLPGTCLESRIGKLAWNPLSLQFFKGHSRAAKPDRPAGKKPVPSCPLSVLTDSPGNIHTRSSLQNNSDKKRQSEIPTGLYYVIVWVIVEQFNNIGWCCMF